MCGFWILLPVTYLECKLNCVQVGLNRQAAQAEIGVLLKLRHPNIVSGLFSSRAQSADGRSLI